MPPLMQAVRLPKEEEEARGWPWGQVAGAAAILLGLILLTTGRFTLDLGVGQVSRRRSAAVRWKGAPRAAVTMQLPFWLGAAVRPANSPQLTQGGAINASVPLPSPPALEAWLQRHLFFNTTRGFFLEVGAGDGLARSASLWLEQAAGWRGVLVEGHPELYARLARNRPDAICLHAAACREFGAARWANRAGRGGAVFELLADEAQRAQQGADGLPRVQCTPLQFLLDKFSLSSIDLLSINVAGAELEVLRGLEFEILDAKVVVVGTGGSTQDAATADLLAQAGFQRLKVEAAEAGAVAVFVHRAAWPSLGSAPGVGDVRATAL